MSTSERVMPGQVEEPAPDDETDDPGAVPATPRLTMRIRRGPWPLTRGTAPGPGLVLYRGGLSGKVGQEPAHPEAQHAAGERPRDTVRRRSDRGPTLGLTLRLLVLDVGALAFGWGAALLGPVLLGAAATGVRPQATALAVAAGLTGLLASRLYRPWVGIVRTVEIQHLGRTSLLTGLVLIAVGQALDAALPLADVVAGTVATFALSALARSLFRSWLRRRRVRGRHTRPVVVVGTGEDAAELCAIIADHPEFGFRVAGTVGTWPGSSAVDAPWLGDLDDAVSAVRGTEASGAIVVASELPAGRLNAVVRELLDAKVHVHLSTGLFGIAHQRFRSLSLAHEPLYYLEHASLARWQRMTKRSMDLVGATILGLVTLPVVAVALLAVRLEGPGPLLTRQRRVGEGGRPFTLYKVRTTRADRPVTRCRPFQQVLGETVDDPGVTRVGRVLRATTIDELPQLANVLSGAMSLVGPRPALPEEVAALDPRHHVRFLVPPGISGLWQVEARDNPASGPYQRLDQFYVENWSIGLDLSIALATVSTAVARSARMLLTLARDPRPALPARSHR